MGALMSIRNVLGAAGIAVLLAGGCSGRDAEASSREVDVPSEEVPPELPIETSESDVHERRDPVTPGEDGVIEPNEDRVIMPPDSLSEGIDHPDARDQLERDRVEEGVPQAGE